MLICSGCSFPLPLALWEIEEDLFISLDREFREEKSGNVDERCWMVLQVGISCRMYQERFCCSYAHVVSYLESYGFEKEEPILCWYSSDGLWLWFLQKRYYPLCLDEG